MEAIRLARESGIRLGVSGQNLTLDAARNPPAQVVDSIRRHKADIVALLTPRAVGGWDATDYRAFYNERAGIAEHDGGLCQEHAERRAFEETVCQWLALNPPAVPEEGRCSACNAPIGDEGLTMLYVSRTRFPWTQNWLNRSVQ